ncbi:MAG: hypothetical protein IPK60_25520 [Sandaracinaceae bacterium]|nr:hypothetical protein [Sandaracinaceae bacterium]
MSNIQFPVFLFGSATRLKMMVKKEATRWLNSREAQGSFPGPVLTSVDPGTVIYLREVSDLNRASSHWRLYFVETLLAEVIEKSDYVNHAGIAIEYEDFVRNYPWGALAVGIGHHFPNSNMVVSKRIRAILAHWNVLASLKFVDQLLQPVDLSVVMTTHFGDVLSMWLHEARETVKGDLERVVDIMEQASEQNILNRIIRRMQELVLVDTRVLRPDRFNDQDWLMENLRKLDGIQLSGLTSGYLPALRRVIYIFDEQP